MSYNTATNKVNKDFELLNLINLDKIIMLIHLISIGIFY